MSNPLNRGPAARTVKLPEAGSSIAIFLFVFAVFGRAIGNDFINYDDPHYVTDNPHVLGGLSWSNLLWAFTTGHGGNWHPLTWISHMLDCQLFGQHAWGHHLAAVILHSLNAVLVFLVLQRATGAGWPSLFVALVFGVHPLHVESVAWVAERKDVLSTFFWMLTLATYGEYVRSARRLSEFSNRPASPADMPHAPASSSFGAGKWYALALFFFVCGLMAKPMLVTLPFVLLLLDYWPFCRFSWDDGSAPFAKAGQLILEKLPFFAMSAAISVVTYFVQQKAGAMDLLKAMPPATRIGNALVSYWRYLAKFFVPAKLSVFYPFPSQLSPLVVGLAAIGILAITCAVIFAGRRHRYLLVGWLWYLGTLVPVIGIIQVGAQSMADRYTYIPMVGILIVTAWALNDLTNGQSRRNVGLSVAALAVVAAYSAFTYWQIGFWKNSETLFRHALSVTEHNTVAHLNLGVAMVETNRPVEAIAEFTTALACSPDDSRGHLNLAGLLAFRKPDEAIEHYRAALQVQPGMADPHLRLGELLARHGDFAEAEKEFRKELAITPDEPNGRVLLASLLRRSGRLDEAIAEYRTVLKASPEHFDAHNNLGIALFQKGQLDEAIAQFSQAVRSKPDAAEGHTNLGLAQSAKGAIGDAITEFREALRIDPNSILARQQLQALLSNSGPRIPGR